MTTWRSVLEKYGWSIAVVIGIDMQCLASHVNSQGLRMQEAFLSQVSKPFTSLVDYVEKCRFILRSKNTKKLSRVK